MRGTRQVEQLRRPRGRLHLGGSEAILFDLDDTILAFTATSGPAWRAVCDEYGPALSVEPGALFDAIGMAREWFWSDAGRHQQGRLDLDEARRQIVTRAAEALGSARQDVARRIADAYTARRDEILHPFPGALETLGTLRQSGSKLGLVTNGGSRGQRAKVERFGLEDLFDCIVIEGEFGVGKPDHRVFLHCLEVLQVGTVQAWMVGDDLQRDIGPAMALGMGTVWVDWEGCGVPTGTPAPPTKVVESVRELVQ